MAYDQHDIEVAILSQPAGNMTWQLEKLMELIPGVTVGELEAAYDSFWKHNRAFMIRTGIHREGMPDHPAHCVEVLLDLLFSDPDISEDREDHYRKMTIEEAWKVIFAEDDSGPTRAGAKS
jgi:hypothetical protein